MGSRASSRGKAIFHARRNFLEINRSTRPSVPHFSRNCFASVRCVMPWRSRCNWIKASLALQQPVNDHHFPTTGDRASVRSVGHSVFLPCAVSSRTVLENRTYKPIYYSSRENQRASDWDHPVSRGSRHEADCRSPCVLMAVIGSVTGSPSGRCFRTIMIAQRSARSCCSISAGPINSIPRMSRVVSGSTRIADFETRDHRL